MADVMKELNKLKLDVLDKLLEHEKSIQEIKVDKTAEGKAVNEATGWQEQVVDFLREAYGGRTDAGKRFQEAVSGGSATPEVWAREIAKLRDESPFIVLKPYVRNIPDARQMGSKVYFPTLPPIVPGALQVGTAPSETAVTVSNVSAIINERGAMIYITKSTEEDAVPSLRGVIEDRLATGMAFDWDDVVVSWLESPATGADIAGTVVEAGPLRGTIIAKAIGSLLMGTYTPQGACLLVTPLQYSSLLQDTQFTDASIRGSDRDSPVRNYLGVDIIVSPAAAELRDADDPPSLGTHRAFLIAKNTVYVADKRDVAIETDYDVSKRQTTIMCSQRFGGTVVHAKGIVEITTIGG